MKRSLLIAVLLVTAAAGSMAGGATKRLPTEWSLIAPTGPIAETQTLPQSATLTADGAHLVVTEGGAGIPGIRVLDARTLAFERDIVVKAAYGAPLPDAHGSGFWASGASTDTLVHADAATGSIDRTIALPPGFWAAAIARAPDGKTLAVSGESADVVAFIDEESGAVSATVKVGRHPAGIAWSLDGSSLFVADWGEAKLDVIDTRTRTVRTSIAVGKHPEALLLSPDGATLYVAETDDDAIGIVDVALASRVYDLNVGLYDGKLFGATPAALTLAPDGRRLFVACSAANAIVVLPALDARTASALAQRPGPLGAIPVGWYPTAIAFDRVGKFLFVANGKGEESSANQQFRPYERVSPGLVSTSIHGSIRKVTLGNDRELQAGLAIVRKNGGPYLQASIDSDAIRRRGPVSDAPGHALVRAGGPIKHVIYVVKENRTYDQVLGDLIGADGDAKLTLFGPEVTPNEHALARRFGIFDRTFANGHVSPDGHNWSMGAFANDYLEKMWPALYGNRRRLYDFEDGADASVPHSSFLWNSAARAGITYRNYGEFTTEPAQAGGDVTSHMPDLAEHTDPKYPGYNLAISDLVRETEWAREFRDFEKAGNLPALEIIRLPNDHTAGTRPGSLTPGAMVAQNDAALGKLVEVISHSTYWKDSAIFVVEDDAQNGPDHIDRQRMTFYLISPYAAGGVQHARYSTAGVMRTVEIILGLPPLSAYDASARPLYEAFTPKADLRPYDAVAPKVDLNEKNGATAYRAQDSAKLDFSHEDRVPDATLNDIVWHAVRGGAATPPPYGLFDRSGRAPAIERN